MLPADKPGFQLFRRNGKPLCIIGGRGYYNQSWPIDECIADGITRTAALPALQQREPDVAQAPFAIGMLHTAESRSRKGAGQPLGAAFRRHGLLGVRTYPHALYPS